MPPNAHILRRAALGTVSHVLGCVMMVPEVLVVVVGPPVHGIPGVRSLVDALGRFLVAFHRWRLVRFLNYDDRLYAAPDWMRTRGYLGRRFLLAFVALGIMVLIAFGIVTGLIIAWQAVRGEPIGGSSGDEPPNGNQLDALVGICTLGVVLTFGAVWGLIGVAMLERTIADRYLGPSEEDKLRRRVAVLADTRAAVVEAVNDERRRIERDLHDGVQQRLVALGMLLGRALRTNSPEHATTLLKQAHEESQAALHDLRDVTWRVYPTALDKDGLQAALEGVADRASVPVALWYDLEDRPDLATETVIYFVASEAVTNALKHGDPMEISILVLRESGDIVVVVRDDGRGGADVGGSGLSGLASRVAAADGSFSVVSPVGGPTVVTARLPELVSV
jgi:signal transduction histidine kinase